MYDVHAHLSFDKFDSLREDILKECKDQGVSKIVEIGCDEQSSQKAHDLAHRYEDIYYTVGYHPSEADDKFDRDILEKYLKLNDKKLVAIGEIGLDYFHESDKKKIQQEVFVSQIELAKQYHKPIIIHNREAGIDVLEILKESKAEKVVYHCYTENWEYAKKILDLGYYISFTGIVTFPKKVEGIQETAEKIPLDRMMIETDCPYLAPQSIRGQLNTPVSVIEIAQYIADLRGVEFTEIEKTTEQNANEFFGW